MRQGVHPSPPFAAVGPGPLVIAHRGGSLEAPENTLAALRHGVAAGSDWQECDVILSRDEHIVVIHDDTLERTTDGRGLVETKSWQDLATLHAGAPHWPPEGEAHLRALGATPPDFHGRYAKEPVPRLGDALSLPGGRLMIELKKSSRPARLAAQVVSAVQRQGAADRVALGSFEFELLDAVHQLDPSLPLVGIAETLPGLQAMLDLPVVVLAVDKAMLSEALAAAPAGVAVWVWTVYTADEAERLAEAGAHGLITDAPMAVLARLRGATADATRP